jgi:hypothetical protein
MDGSLATQHEQTEDERVHAGEETGLEYGGLRRRGLELGLDRVRG